MKRALTLPLLVSVIALVALAAGPVYGGNGQAGLEKADQAREKHTNSLMARDGVVGVGVGLNPAGKPAVVVLTTREGVRDIPRELDGVPVHVLVTGEIFAGHHCRGGHADDPACGNGGDGNGNGEEPPPANDCPDTTEKYRPACIGISTGHPAITAGTIGARVRDTNGNLYALSNNHVYANSNDANINDEVLQPGAIDDGDVGNQDHLLGTLHAFEPIIFNNQACTESESNLDCNIMDAAIALSSRDELGNATPSDGYGTPRFDIATASINQKVMKYGRTTMQTKGQVYATNATVDVGYGVGKVARFVGQIVITPGNFSAGGDSGSLVVVEGKGRDRADDRKPVGLLFAGSPLVTIASPIGPVLTQFNVTIDGD